MTRSKAQGVVLTLIQAATVAAWSYLYFQSRRMETLPMQAMWMPPAGASAWHLLSDFAYVYAMWAVMMAAMMLPAALPMLSA